VAALRSIADLASALGPAGLTGRPVFVRADLNVPLTGGEISDDGRIRASLPTIRTLRDAGAVVVVASHLGRPAGQPEQRYSMAPVAARLSELLGTPVTLATDTAGPGAAAAVAAAAAAGPGQVVLLENLRFEAGETAKDAGARGALADRLVTLLGDGAVYVGDGFGAVHRAHASVVDLPDRLPHAAGGLVLAETAVLDRLTTDPARPFAVVLGGSKVSDKLGVIDHLLSILTAGDRLVIGGGMLFTFLAAQGHGVGKSLLETGQVDVVRGYLDRAARAGIEVLLPVDVTVADRFAADAEPRVVASSAIGEADIGMDIGPAAAAAFASAITDARTVFWNGPMGVFEFPAFAAGTRAVARALADATAAGALTVVGGGDSAAAVRSLGFADASFGHISTGGGASLEFLEGRTLPGIAALERASR